MSGNTMDVDPGWFSPQTMMGTRDFQVFNLYGERKLSGQVSGPIFPTNGIRLLVAAIGTDAITGTGPYTHTISEATLLQSLTVEKNIGGFQSLQFAGCRVGKLSVKATTGNEAASISADMEAQSALVMDTPTAVSVTNESPFVFSEASLTLLGNARADASSVQIDIDNGLVSTYTFSGAGNNGPGFITPASIHVSGTVDLMFSSLDDATFGDYTKMVNGTLGTLSLGLTHPASAGSVTLSCPQVALSKFANDLKISDVVMTSLSFEATRALPAGSSISAVVSNARSTVY